MIWNAKGALQAIRTAGAMRRVLRLGVGLIDVRIAGWMVNPDNQKVGI